MTYLPTISSVCTDLFAPICTLLDQQFTADFAQAVDLELPPASRASKREASSSSITPRGSPSRQPEPLPVVPQYTGEWLPSFRRSLLGGRSLNRFSAFVTSGAEAFVLQGNGEDVSPSASRHVRMDTTASIRDESPSGVPPFGGEAERHFVDAGPAWKPKVPPFRILVHSPSKRNSGLSGAYTIYAVTSLFDPPSHNRSLSDENAEAFEDDPGSPVRITVHRRFSHFVVLHTALTRRLPGIALPPLPEKQYAGRFNADFVEARRGDLERYLSRVVRHPVARYAEVLTFFLGCESDFVSTNPVLAAYMDFLTAVTIIVIRNGRSSIRCICRFHQLVQHSMQMSSIPLSTLIQTKHRKSSTDLSHILEL